MNTLLIILALAAAAALGYVFACFKLNAADQREMDWQEIARELDAEPAESMSDALNRLAVEAKAQHATDMIQQARHVATGAPGPLMPYVHSMDDKMWVTLFDPKSKKYWNGAGGGWLGGVYFGVRGGGLMAGEYPVALASR